MCLVRVCTSVYDSDLITIYFRSTRHPRHVLKTSSEHFCNRYLAHPNLHSTPMYNEQSKRVRFSTEGLCGRSMVHQCQAFFCRRRFHSRRLLRQRAERRLLQSLWVDYHRQVGSRSFLIWYRTHIPRYTIKGLQSVFASRGSTFWHWLKSSSE